MKDYIIPIAIVWAALILGLFYYFKPSAYMECVNNMVSQGVTHPPKWTIICGHPN